MKKILLVLMCSMLLASCSAKETIDKSDASAPLVSSQIVESSTPLEPVEQVWTDEELLGMDSNTFFSSVKPSVNLYYFYYPGYDYIDYPQDGMILAYKNGKFGFLNESDFSMIIPFIYDTANHFTDGYASVSQNGKFGCIDKQNNTILPFDFANVFPVHNNLIVVYTFERTWRTSESFSFDDNSIFKYSIYSVANDMSELVYTSNALIQSNENTNFFSPVQILNQTGQYPAIDFSKVSTEVVDINGMWTEGYNENGVSIGPVLLENEPTYEVVVWSDDIVYELMPIEEEES